MFEYIGALISYVCQLAIILFVAKEFGFIKTGKTEEEETVGTGNGNSKKPAQSNPFGNLMEQMGPMVQNMMQGMQQQQAQQGGALAQQPKPKKATVTVEAVDDGEPEEGDDALLKSELE